MGCLGASRETVGQEETLIFGARADQATVEGAKLAVTMHRRALVIAADELERLAYVLRDQAGLGHEAGKAMDAARAAKEAAGVE